MNIKSSLSAIFVSMIFLVSLPIVNAQGWSCNIDNTLCGPQSLLAVFDRMGVRTDLEELKALSGYKAETGTTMLGLQTAAKAKGLQAVGVKIGVEELAGLKIPAIAHLWDNHFVVIEAGDEGMLKMTDPPAEPKMVSKEDFKKAYSGFALLIAKDADSFPKSETTGPDVRFDGYTWDLGSIYEGELAYHTFKVRNAGNKDLVISKTDSSCTCLVPLVSSQKILPGGWEGGYHTGCYEDPAQTSECKTVISGVCGNRSAPGTCEVNYRGSFCDTRGEESVPDENCPGRRVGIYCD